MVVIFHKLFLFNPCIITEKGLYENEETIFAWQKLSLHFYAQIIKFWSLNSKLLNLGH